MNSYAVASELSAFARRNGFEYIQRTISHWHIVAGKVICNVYYGKKGFSLYVDSSTPNGAFRTGSIDAIYAKILHLFETTEASTAVIVAQPAVIRTVTTTVGSPRQATRLSASKRAGGLRCRVTTTCPSADTDRPCLTSVTLISEGNPPIAVHLHDGETDEIITTHDAASVALTVESGEPTTTLIRLLRFAAHTLEEMVERNARLVREPHADPV